MSRKQKYDTPICVICALLFATFSFLYIYVFQGERLALLQDYLSKGQTTNNTLVTALLVTILLVALQYLLNKWSKLHGRYEALSYLPSCAILALITRFDSSFSYSWVQWVVTLLVVMGLNILIVWIDRNTLQLRDTRFFKQLTPNLGVMALLFAFVGCWGNNNASSTMELVAWKYTHNGEYAKVLNVGRMSDDCNVKLTALRNLALAKIGQLGDKLFAYPQPYGSDGLIMNRYNVQTPLYGSEEFYNALGGVPYGGEKAAAFYKRMMLKSDSVYLKDLYAAALLLDKDLDAFVSLTASNREASSSVSVHTQEAWMIYNEQHPFTPIAFVPDEAVLQHHREYVALREAHADDPLVMQNLCKRKFGKTYWYYYDFLN